MYYWKQLYLFFTLIFTMNTEGIATPILERIVTVKAQSLSLANVLDNISVQANFQFSYNPNIINADKKISLNIASETVRAVLKNLLGNQFQFKQKGNYLIIQKLKADEQIISGYVKDNKTGKNLENVTVYDKKSLASATTDSSGYYEIVTRKPIEQLTIARFNYGDTSFQIRSIKDTPLHGSPNGQHLDVSLIPKLETTSKVVIETKAEIVKETLPKDEFAEQTILSNLEIRQAIKRSVAELQRITERNITEDLLRKWQFSIAPYVSTNLALSGNVVNKFSLNATVGYSKGNRGLEVGGIGNINQGKVTGVQVASLFNIVNSDMRGLQISSIVNRTHTLQGLQISGITNSTDRIKKGLQISGINNHADIASGGVVQIAGIFNKTDLGRTAFQVAGIANQADTVGCQIGLINNANKLRGVQIGLINIADTSSGILLGVLNIVKKGYHVLEVATNDVTPFNLAYRTGTKRFYTIYAFGGSPKIMNSKNDILSAGLGFGTSFWLGKTIGFTLDVTAHRFSIDGKIDKQGGLVKLSPALNIQITKKLGISFAPVWNSYYLNSKNQTPLDISLLNAQIIPKKAKASEDWMQWWGWSASLRLF
jgi:hypothetical protein